MNDLFQADPVEPQIDENKDYLSELVGENKKFKDTQALAKGKAYADQMVETLTKRVDQMRDDYLRMSTENKAKAKLEELLDQWQQKASDPNNTHREPEDNTPKFDPAQLDKIFSEKIQAHEISKRQSENAKMVTDKLREQFGSNYTNVLKERTEALGLTQEFVNNLARENPTFLLKNIGLESKSDNLFQSPPQSQQRNDSFAPKGAPKRTWSYYQDLKRKDPRAWLDRKIAIQMAQDAEDLGESFRDGDYYVKGLH